jgi:hypothetical protein
MKMSTITRPTLILHMNLDERTYSEEVVAEITRSYSHFAPTFIAPLDEDGSRQENTIRFQVKIRSPFWSNSDEGANEAWSDVLEWLKSKFYKGSANMVAFNNMRRDQGGSCLTYAWMELELGEHLMALRLNSDSSIPEQALELIDRVRTLSQEGPLSDEGIACVRMPSRASYEAQLAAAQEAARAVNVGQVSEDESPDAAVGTEATPEAETAEAGEATVSEELAPVVVEHDLHYTAWGVEYNDGSVREFDAEAGAFIA